MQYDSRMREVVFIGIDWGTSSARAYAFDRQGEILASVGDSPDQAMGVQTLRQRLGREPTSIDFGAALETLLAALSASASTSASLFALPPLTLTKPGSKSAQRIPILACGMIGSKQGLVDAGYSPCPTSPALLAKRLVQAQCGRFKLWVTPGLRMPTLTGVLPDFMRGEETQVLGAHADGLLVLPGSHSKWVDVDQGVITQFETYFSGELFAVLKEHSILGRLFASARAESVPHGQAEPAFEPAQTAAFVLGINTARKNPHNLLRHLFSTRALGIVGQLNAEDGASFLSGLLIGHEVCAALSHRGAINEVRLVGSPQLCKRYAQALESFNIKAHSLGNTSALGLWRLGRAAELI